MSCGRTGVGEFFKRRVGRVIEPHQNVGASWWSRWLDPPYNQPGCWLEYPIVGALQAIMQVVRMSPAERVEARHIELFAGSAVRLRWHRIAIRSGLSVSQAKVGALTSTFGDRKSQLGLLRVAVLAWNDLVRNIRRGSFRTTARSIILKRCGSGSQLLRIISD